MANIRTLDAPPLALQPTETGIDALSQSARRIGAFYNQAAQDYHEVGSRIGSAIKDAGEVAVKYEEHQEVSKGAKDFAQMQFDLTKQWNDTAKNADPNDPAVAAKFREQVLEPALQKYSDGFLTDGGQKFAQGHVAALRNHFFEKTAADQSTLAGVSARVNTAQVVNGLASTARMDPSSIDFQLKNVDSMVDGIVSSSPTLTPAEAARVREEVGLKAKEGIVTAGALGLIEKNPNIDLDAFEKKYGQYMPPGRMQGLIKAAKEYTKNNLLTQKQLDIAKRNENEQKAHADANQAFIKNVKIDPQTQRPNLAPGFFKDALDIVKNNPDAPNAASIAKAYIDWGEHQQNLKDESPRTDPGVKQDFVDRMFSTDNPTTEVQLMRAQVEGKLNRNDFAALHQLVKTLDEEPLKGLIWHDTMEAVKADMMVSGINLPGKDTVGIANYAKWAQTFIPQYLAMKRAGTLPPNALDVKDPESLISKSMAPFKRTVAQKMQDYVDLVAGGNMSASTPLTPKPTQTVPALPPPDQRKAGSVYPTARGQMKWTGVDWVKP